MQRRQLLKHAGLAGILAAGTAPAVVQAAEKIRWRLASSFPKVLDTIYGGADTFSNKVREMSGGNFEISVHAGGELMPAFGVLDGAQQGTVECAHTAPYYFFGKDETFALDCAIPFGLNARQLNAWIYDGNGLELLRNFYANYNLVNFPMGNTGVQMGGWYRKKINSLQDMKGLKMRIGGFGGRVLERLGSIPQNIPGGEVYQALEKGTIDATEWVGPYDDLKLGFYKVAPHYAYPAWWEGGAQLSLLVNKDAYNKLSSDYKAIIDTASTYANLEMLAKYDARNPNALKELVANGTKLFPMPKDIMNAAFAASKDVYAELSSNNPEWKKIFVDYEAFRKDINAWFRFSESGYDSFMQAQKL